MPHVRMCRLKVDRQTAFDNPLARRRTDRRYHALPNRSQPFVLLPHSIGDLKNVNHVLRRREEYDIKVASNRRFDR